MSLRNSLKGPPQCVVGASANLFSIKCGPKRLGPAGFLTESETWEKGAALSPASPETPAPLRLEARRS